MDIKVKQRLIGALVVGALVIIFLPMLVVGPESERPADATDVPIEAPTLPAEAEDGFVTKVIPMPGQGATAPASPSPSPATPTPETSLPSPDSDALATVDATEGNAPRMDALADAPVAAVDAATGQPVGPAPAPAPVDAAATRPPAPAVSSPTPPPVVSTPSPAPVAAPPPRAVPATTPPIAPPPAVARAVIPGDLVVNVGSFGNQDRANALLARLKAAGLPAYGENITVNGQGATRVRVGPYVDRAAAESARLRAGSISGTATAVVVAEDERARRVVSTASATTARSAPQPLAAPAVGFAVQLGAFASEAEAQALVTRARGAGFPVFLQSVSTSTGTLWRVRLGPDADRAGAERRQAEAASRLGIRGNVVAHP